MAHLNTISHHITVTSEATGKRRFVKVTGNKVHGYIGEVHAGGHQIGITYNCYPFPEAAQTEAIRVANAI